MFDKDLGYTQGLSLSAKAACGEVCDCQKKSEGYNLLYEYENGMKLHGGVKEVKTSKYNQTAPNLEVGRSVYDPL
ncbi:hypothetical protein KY290_006294 [Solanum tuberosum]|uniref:Uncharacterized protein n=1 Tax=Solanum tuberosum TaxID=4113 RepID=A0ABQ7WIY2_SOLTU|nr:hypothetical protein KY285_005882 [Solanum tuberosum]KAH0779867.1 hypothetical protein KY290_006294 [Solanum tuberosum]